MPKYSVCVALTNVYVVEYEVDAENEDLARDRLYGLHRRGFLHGEYDIKPDGGWLPDDVKSVGKDLRWQGWESPEEERLDIRRVEIKEEEVNRHGAPG